MEFSVIIPTHNDLETLGATLRSVLDQADVDLEVIVVNDGGESPAALIRSFNDTRVTLLDLEENGGVGAARNAGHRHASGDILYFLDADDLVAQGLFRLVAARFEDPAVCCVVSGHRSEIPEHPTDPISPPAPLHDAPALNALSTEDFCSWFAMYHEHFLPSFLFLRAEWCKTQFTGSMWNEARRNAVDTFLFLNLAARTTVYRMEVEGVTYRRRATSLSRKSPDAAMLARVYYTDLFLQQTAEEARHSAQIRRVRQAALHMKQNAVRQVARHYARSGRRREGLALMWRYLWGPFDPKMAAELIRTGLGYRH